MIVILTKTINALLITVLIVPIYFISATLYCVVNIFSVLLNTENQNTTMYEYRLGVLTSLKEYVEHLSLIKGYYNNLN